jgi:branched-chain amino acid transport system substrate-binding protein
MDRRQLLQAALCAPVGITLSSHSHAQADIVRIGHSGPLSGLNKDLGEDIRDGALAYFKSVNNAGGINCRKLELVSLDDGNDAARAGANAKKLIDDGVVALFGYASATVSRPALPHVEAARIPFFAPFTGADSMRGFNKHVYNVRASYVDELTKIVNHYTTLGSKTFAVVHYDDAVGKENLAAVERALKARGVTLASSVALARVNPDIAAGVATLVKAAPDVIVQTTLFKASADIVKGVKAKGVNSQFVNTSFAAATSLAKEVGRDGVGLAMARVVPHFQQRSVPVVNQYLKAFEAAVPGETPSFTSLESFIAAKVLAEAIKRAGKSVTRESLTAALDGLGTFDVGGFTVTFSANNHNGSSYVDLTILNRDLRFAY